jgi:hypothetical protein
VKGIALFLSIVAGVFLASCGGGSSSSSTTNPVSKIANRAFVSNASGGIVGTVHIIDAAHDKLSITNNISAGSAPTLMVESSDKKKTVVFSSGTNALIIVDNATEAATSTLPLRNPTESFAISSDDRFVFVAERNTIALGATLAGAVEIFDNNNLSAGATVVSVPGARSLVLSHNNNTLLVFSDDPTPSPSNGIASNTQVFFINTGNSAAGATPVPGFDRPVFAVFTSDDSTAYVVNCGAECGGTTAGVAAVSVAAQSITARTAGTVPAHVALLNGTTLFVAGTVPAAGATPAAGFLNILNAGSLSVANPAGAPAGIPIPDGIHDRIALGSNGKLFVGARACSNTTQGCLAIYDTTSNPTTAVIHAPFGTPSGTPLPADITSIEPIPNRSIVYVCEGGELNIYNTTNSTLQTNPVIDIVGRAVDVKEVF